MTDKQNAVVVSDMLSKLRMAQCSSCSCLTKTNKPAYHKEECLYRVLSEAITLLSASSKQAVDVGKPVAWVNPSNLARFKGDIGATVYQCSDSQVPLYRHAQPPAKVVLPEPKTRRTHEIREEAYDDGWNACLDEVAKLNQCSEVATVCGGAPNIGGQTPTIAAAYRCHLCGNETPPPAPYKLYVSCECGATTAASAAMAEPKP